MQREHHHRCYRKWQEVFLLEQLYREVNDEVREMQEYSQLQYLQRQEAAQRERDRQRLEEIRQQDEAAKERDRQRQEEMRRQDETAKERERLYLLALREKEEADRERDRISVLALREKEEADKEWQRIYSQQLRAKEEAEQERDRQLQNAVYIASAGLGTGAIVASSAGLITASSPITVRLLLGGSLHPFGVAVILSLLAAAGVGGGVWAWRKARLRMSDRAFQQKLEKFKQLLSQNQELFSPDDRESLGELVKAQPDGVCQLWGAIADWQRQNPSHPASSQILWIQSKPPLLSTAKQWAKSLGQWLRYPLFLFVDSCQPENYQEELLKEIKPPTPSEKKVEAFIQLVGCRDLLSSEDSKNLQEEASHWPEKVEGLAEAIGNWCQVPGRSRIYEKLLELQKDSMRNQTNRGEKDYKARLQGAIDSL
ncbi:hypothetical protein [Kamptonema sp. PCC 6506]|uniref:hypothetical protein n=2 Tax=Kamptonema TaxID=1501433 RepID=UPI0012F4EE0E|nr:hypothetical protein [Kamptonema sp. PCC 6506]